MNIQLAKTILITNYLANKGYYPVRNNNIDYWYLSPFRDEKTASFKVNILINKYYDFGTATGGDIFSLSIKLGASNVKDALKDIGNTQPQTFSFHQPKTTNLLTEEKSGASNIKVISHRPLQNLALINYALSRGIKEEVARKYCAEIYFQILNSSKKYFSIGIKTDRGGWAIRNKYFKTAISPFGITTIKNGCDTVTVFEGFFDFLSYQVLYQNIKSDFIILNSIANIQQAEEQFDLYKKLHFFLDNDLAGNALKRELSKKLGENFIDESSKYLDFKDLNEKQLYDKYNIAFKN